MAKLDYTKFDHEAPQFIADLVADFRLTPIQAAGFPGNFAAESRYFTDIIEDGAKAKGWAGGTGYGQWTGMKKGERRYECENYWTRNHYFGASSLAECAQNYIGNYKWLWVELHGPEGARVLPKLRKANTIEEAVQIVGKEYERPANLSKSLAERIRGGKRALDLYTKRLPKPTPGAGEPLPDVGEKPMVKPTIPQPISLPAPAMDLSQLLGLASGAASMLPGPLGPIIGIVGKVLANNAANPQTSLEPVEVPAILNQIVTEAKISPEVQHVTNSEPAWYQQRSKWAAIIGALTPIAALAGFNVSPDMANTVAGGISMVGSAIAAYLAYRAGTAKKPLFTREPDPRDKEMAEMRATLAALTAKLQ